MRLEKQLDLDRCPHCQVHHPRLTVQQEIQTTSHSGRDERLWRFYSCVSCGGVVTAWAWKQSPIAVVHYFPESTSVDEAIPDRAGKFLSQAIESLHTPAGALMLCASAVDAMLKKKGLTDGTLYTRIDLAAEQHLITTEMAAWAHEVRLDANDQRHADDSADLPSQAEAQKCIDFTLALGEFLFVLPARVERGRKSGG